MDVTALAAAIQSLIQLALQENDPMEKQRMLELALERTKQVTWMAGTNHGLGLDFIGLDTSYKVVEQLLAQDLTETPPIAELEKFLQEPPAVALPVSSRVMRALSADAPCQHLLSHFTAAHSADALADLFSKALMYTSKGNSKPWTADCVNQTFVDVLAGLEALACIKKCLGVTWERDKGDKQSGMTIVAAKLNALRPDGVIRLKDGIHVLFKWVEKEGGAFEDAVNDLVSKQRVWPAVYYGELEYLLTLAAAGTRLKFFAIPRSNANSTIPVTSEYTMSSLADRARLLMTVVQVYRFLGAMTRNLPTAVAPVNKELKAKIHGGITRSIFFDEAMTVHKAIHPWSQFSITYSVELRALQSMYAATREVGHLVHATAGPSVVDNTYQVTLEPVGYSRPYAVAPTGQKQLAYAAGGLLKGLSGLHGAGYLHRDVQQRNVSCDMRKEYYFLLDLELACATDNVPSKRFAEWPDMALVDGCYTAKSDVYCLGMMLHQWSSRICEVSNVGTAFLQSLLVPAREQESSACELLQAAQAWLIEQDVHITL